MGPSWYLMPDAFEQFFNLMGTTADKELDLVRLTPAYQTRNEGLGDRLVMSEKLPEIKEMFESIEPGSGKQLQRYLDSAQEAYELSIKHFLYTNFKDLRSFLHPEVLAKLGKFLKLLTTSLYDFSGQFVKDDRLKKMLNFPVSPQYEAASFPMAMRFDWSEDEEKANRGKGKPREIETLRVKPGVFELPQIDKDHPYISAFKHREDSFEGAKRRQRGISHYFKKPTLDIATDYARQRTDIPESTDIMSNKDYELYSKVKTSVSKYLRSKEGRELDSHLKNIKRDLT